MNTAALPSKLDLRAQPPAASHAVVHRRLMLSLALWAGAAVGLTALGVTARLPIQALPLPVALGITVPLLFYFRNPAFRDYIHALDLRALTLFNVWRVPAALAFFYYGAQGELPATFVQNAGWGDFIAGVLAPLVVFGVAKRSRRQLQGFTGFHLFSVADFVVAVGTGFAFSLLGDPLMNTLKEWPMAIIPLFGVPVTGAFSVMALHRLFTRRA